MKELTAIFLGEHCRRGDWFLGEAQCLDDGRGVITVKGMAEPGELTQGLEYRFYGHDENHPKHGPSFQIKTFVRSKPHTRQGVTRYLQLAPGIGSVTAAALWGKFQQDAVRILRESPEVAAAAVPGRFSKLKAEEAAAFLREMAALEDCQIELLDLLSGRGFLKKTAQEAIRTWGNRAAERIKYNPYLLMAFRGCGFLRTDAMYLDLGYPPEKLKRQALCIWHSLASDSEGHTWYPVDHIIKGLQQKIAGAKLNGPRAATLAKRAKMISTYRDEQQRLWVAERRKAVAEEYVAQYLATAIKEDAKWPAIDDNCGFTNHQAQNLLRATAGGAIAILGGSPGTGKTYMAAQYIKRIIQAHGWDAVAACAPTGKAAVRMWEMFQAYGIDLVPTTIHRLLQVESVENGHWSFRHNQWNPLPYRFVFVDESSMNDVSIMAHLLAARAKGTHLFFIGDIGQLLPVGHGAPLRDMIAADLPYGELREIHRNAGTIVQACAQIRDGKIFDVDDTIDLQAEPPRNLKLIRTANDKETAGRIVQIVTRIKERGVVDAVLDVQVIVAVNLRSAVSRCALNRELQNELNPGESVGDSPFRPNDKVIQLKNAFLPAAKSGEGNQDGKFFVANGDQGSVVEVQERLTIVEFTLPKRLVKIPRGKARGNDDSQANEDDAGTGCDLDLAYAITCHKAQGSEWPVSVIALDEYPGASRVCSREWLYTGISRAKQVCFPVGKKATADAMCRRVALRRRKTFLKERIQQCLNSQ